MKKKYLLSSFLGTLFVLLLLPAVFGVYPSVTSFTITDGNDEWTNLDKPELKINAVDANGMQFSCDGASWEDMVPYASSFSDFNIQSCGTSEGMKTVYIQVESEDGNMGLGDLNADTIKLDYTAPTITDLNRDSSWTDHDQNILFLCDDSGANQSGCASITVSSVDHSGTYDVNDQALIFTSDGNNGITYYAEDVAGNQSTSTTIYALIDDDPGLLDSIDENVDASNGWYNGDVLVTINASNTGKPASAISGMNCFYRLNMGAWQFPADSNSFTITADANVLAVCTDGMDRNTDLVDANYLIDKEAPNSVSDLDIEETSDNDANLDWNPVTDNGDSNIQKYCIYRNGGDDPCNFSIGDTCASGQDYYKATMDADTTTYKDTSVSRGTNYCYKVRAMDYAGNLGGAAQESIQISSSSDDDEGTNGSSTVEVAIKIKLGSKEVSYAKRGAKLKIEGDFSKPVQGALIRYRYYEPSESWETLEGPNDSVDHIEKEITLDDDHNKICFNVQSDEVNSVTKCVTIDSEDPKVSWKNAPSTLEGEVEIKVEATDNYEIEEVSIYVGNTEITGVDQDKNIFSVKIKTSSFENGTYTLKAVAEDKAGNKKEITKSVKIENIVTPADAAQKAINDANAQKTIVKETIEYYNTQGLKFPESLLNEKAAADKLLKDAETLKGTDPAGAEQKANSAKEKYEEIISKIQSTSKGVGTYEYDKAALYSLLEKAGLNSEQIKEALSLMENANVQRKLEVVKVGPGGEETYQIRIEVTFTNDTNNDKIKIVEFIPKELITYAQNIFSHFEFNILQADPVIEFVVDVAPGETKTITYGTGEVTKEKADKAISEKLVEKFVSPPIILLGETGTENLVVFSIGDLSVWIILILLAVVLIIAAALVIFGKEPDHGGFGYGDTKRSRIKKKLSIVKKKGKSKKWAYKK